MNGRGNAERFRSQAVTSVLQAYLSNNSESFKTVGIDIPHLIVVIAFEKIAASGATVRRPGFYGASEGGAIDEDEGNPDFYDRVVLDMIPFNKIVECMNASHIADEVATSIQFTIAKQSANLDKIYDDNVRIPLARILEPTKSVLDYGTELTFYSAGYRSAALVGFYAATSAKSDQEREIFVQKVARQVLPPIIPAVIAANIVGEFQRLMSDPIVPAEPNQTIARASALIDTEYEPEDPSRALQLYIASDRKDGFIVIANKLSENAIVPLRTAESVRYARTQLKTFDQHVEALSRVREEILHYLEPGWGRCLSKEAYDLLGSVFSLENHDTSRINITISALKDIQNKLGALDPNKTRSAPILEALKLLLDKWKVIETPEVKSDANVCRALLKYSYQHEDNRRGIHPYVLVHQLFNRKIPFLAVDKSEPTQVADVDRPFEFWSDRLGCSESNGRWRFAFGGNLSRKPPKLFVDSLVGLWHVLDTAIHGEVRLNKDKIKRNKSLEISVFELEVEKSTRLMMSVELHAETQFPPESTLRYPEDDQGNLAQALTGLSSFVGLEAPVFFRPTNYSLKDFRDYRKKITAPFVVASLTDNKTLFSLLLESDQ